MPRLDLESLALDQGCAREVLKKLRTWDVENAETGIGMVCAAPDGGIQQVDGWPSEFISHAIFGGELGPFPTLTVRAGLAILMETALVDAKVFPCGRCYSVSERGEHVADYLLGRIAATPEALRILLNGDV